MYTFTLQGNEIRVQFPYHWLDVFKCVVRPEDRRFRPEPRLWALTVAGWRDLADAHGAYFAPLPLDVLDAAYPLTPRCVNEGHS